MNNYTYNHEDFVRFSFAVGEYLSKLGLSEWKVEAMHDQIGDRVAAQCQYHAKAKNAVFRLTKSVEYDYGMETCPEKLALHEVLHLLLADYCLAASTLKDDMHDIVVAHEHSVIHRLMRVIPVEIEK